MEPQSVEETQKIIAKFNAIKESIVVIEAEKKRLQETRSKWWNFWDKSPLELNGHSHYSFKDTPNVYVLRKLRALNKIVNLKKYAYDLDGKAFPDSYACIYTRTQDLEYVLSRFKQEKENNLLGQKAKIKLFLLLAVSADDPAIRFFGNNRQEITANNNPSILNNDKKLGSQNIHSP